MQIFHDMKDWLAFRRSMSPKSIGFVPTMGNLHKGHASLFQQSKLENEYTIASIFVNPTQFNRSDDFTHYPRTIEADLALLKELNVDYCLLPTENAVYCDGYRFQIQETELCQLMEGKHRPGHFTGVLTVVMKLLNLVKPHQAYFGEKDYQQYLLIREMVSAFFMEIHVKSCPTIREQSRLAFSSRNNRLTPEQRIEADKFARIFHQPQSSCELIANELKQNNIHVEYIEEYQGRRYIAVTIGQIRLIDNYSL
ncbi:pantoate--beta-alanine ligase [Legionella hackeliae]|uniref:Pantothenate synthetase n=1 Tax=Legionella hackeliae TaxID=449 RepID=A0A0A8USV3_LEGHA|nr:pantoate--beta-alanine ligase [Legionella hackeliae]KTD12536.1 pantoate-beta-alanine ligase [Legionella hackeliae]CEK11950.1 Pantothenate synthetase [Legionella hackeliae]STX48724.1 pantoate--beta-alanine ligase [Legionella hackeliae]